jgi:hypothetical protein
MHKIGNLQHLFGQSSFRPLVRRHLAIFSALSISVTWLDTRFRPCVGFRHSSKTTRFYFDGANEVRNYKLKPVKNHHPKLNFCKMDSSENDEIKDLKRLSAAELRRRRLAALGILQPINIVSTSTIDNNVERTNNNMQGTKIDNTCEVIDLLDSGDEDEVQVVNRSSADVHSNKRSVSHIQRIDSCSSSDKDVDTELMSSFRKHLESVGSNSSEDFERKESKKTRNNRKRFREDLGSESDNDEIQVVLETIEQNGLDKADGVCGREWTFKVATWNVWFGPYGDGQPHPGPRMRAIVRLLREHSTADVPLLFIGLQEVIDPLATFLIPALESAGYRVYRQQGAAYGCAVAVHRQLEIVSQSWIPYSNTVMMRGYYQVRAKLPNKHKPDHCPEIVFTTTHLESYTGPEYTGAKERPQQLLEVEQFCNKQVSSATNPASVAIITGDLNWDDEGLRRKLLDPVMSNILQDQDQWHDSWLLTASANSKSIKQKAVEGYTYDAKINPMLGGHLRRRFDRCLVRGNSNNGSVCGRFVAQTIETLLLGQEAIQDLTWDKKNKFNGSIKETQTAPSDHFGLVATVRLAESTSFSSAAK